MNDLKLKVYDKVDNKIFNVATVWFNNDGVKTVQIYGKASAMPQKGIKNRNTFSARTPVQRLDRKRIELLSPTGKKDKNDIEIYQDDLLKDKNGKICRAEWISGGWAFINLIPSAHYEIVGNYHTNPELLND